MDIEVILYFLAIAFVSPIPFEQFLDWLHVKNRQLSGATYADVFMPTKGFRIAFTVILSFLKGYLPLYFGYEYLDLPYIVFGVILSLALHLWSPYRLFKFSGYATSFILGVYTFYFMPMILIFPILLCLCAALTNSIAIGTLSSLALQFILMGLVQNNPDVFLVNIGVFLLMFFRWAPTIFTHFEEKPITLLESLKSR